MRVLDLFSGVGGFSLGLERAGMTTVAFCEIEPYCRAVLKKHWPDVPCYEDIRELRLPKGFADVVCGGFPCQDISSAGLKAGITGARSGLWSQMLRVISEVRPRFAVIENVSVLRTRGLEQVLQQLHAIGYDAEWHCIPASALGAPHQRDRIWIIGYPQNQGKSARALDDEAPRVQGLGNAYGPCLAGLSRTGGVPAQLPDAWGPSWWEVEPDVGRVVDGFPGRVDRVKCLGNAVVPQIPGMIGHALMRLV